MSATTRLRALLFADQRRKRVANQAYVYVVHLAHLLLELAPGPVRNAAFRAALGRAGRDVFFDYRVYVKFPWLVEIGDRVSVNRGVELFPDYAGGHRIVLGSDVYLAPHVRFLAAGHDLADLTRHVGADIVVGDGVWIGAGALILPGVTIGDGSVIGAGSVVTHDVPADTIVAGVPARPLATRGAP